MAVSVKEVAMFTWLHQLLQRLFEVPSTDKVKCPRCACPMTLDELSRGKIWFCHTCGYFKDYL
jgi:ribosomal protein L37AE/L43A